MPRRLMAQIVSAGLRAAAVALALLATPTVAQQVMQAAPSGVLTIDPERLFEESLFGSRVIADVEARAEFLQTENRRIEAELTEEERELTELRPETPVADFRAMADAFDAKVDEIREEQDGKARELQEMRETGQQEFFKVIGPILLALVSERQAAILLDRRTVFLSAGAADVTDAAITLIDEEIGTGEEAADDDDAAQD